MRIVSASALALTIGIASPATSDPLAGDKAISLYPNSGERIEIGKITFAKSGDKSSYSIALKNEAFADHFLSMRPFKCLEGTEKHWCQVPYPYDIRREVSADDLTDLEYDLLFLWKGATEYGINMWNGVYYQLSIDGDRITGALHEMDMDILSAPPEAGNLRPLGEGDLHEADPESHWLPRIVIE